MYALNQEDILEIANEYRMFGIQKSAIQEIVKSMSKQMTEKLEELQLPKIKKLLTKLGTIENESELKCTHCNIWSGKNKASLAAHIRNCKNNPKK